MKNNIKMIFCLLAVVIYSCSKQETDFREYLDGHEIVYTGSVGKVSYLPGNLRVALKWKSSTDPTIEKYVVYWNNKLDSQVVKVTNRKDSISTVISGLQEYVYSFTIFSYDAAGNKSIPQEVNNVKVYGSIYNNTLLNRGYDALNPYEVNEDGSVKLNFITPDTINITTKIKYTNTSNLTEEIDLLPASSSITLNNYLFGTPIQYKSSYIPLSGAIDTFYVNNFDEFPTVYRYMECDKSLFKEMMLPNDVYADHGTSLSNLWDGSVGPQPYPNIFHSNASSLPHHFTFDLGKVYNNLGRLEETGRDCCHNPVEFEVWGIEDISNAATTLPSNSPGWEAESIAKGWTLLKDVVRSDNGQNAFIVDLMDNPPPVRYIRIRVKRVDNGDSENSNISELTFWDKQ